MTPFTRYDATTAGPSRPAFEAAERQFGFVPDALATMAGSPQLVEAFSAANAAFHNSSFDAREREVIVMTVARELGCDVCLALHSALLRKLAPALEAPLRTGAPLPEPKLEALRRAALHLLATRGQMQAAELDAFFAAGFSQRHALELVLAAGTLTLSIFSNRLTRAVVDAAFAAKEAA